MWEKAFEGLAVNPAHPHWELFCHRASPLYEREESMRNCFYRDYTRILHSTAFRRLKHKTQVFPNVGSDHVCTRMEHVLHVESVSSTIAEMLGLSVHLTRAIALGHDIGHSPFGHAGENILASLAQEHLGTRFWHEQNGLRFADEIELLPGPGGIMHNLSLTYAVRDGIISHCGELDENGLFPREDIFDLSVFDAPGKYQSATWEGCVVKIADKIAYLGRDIEDADTLSFLGEDGRKALLQLQTEYGIDAMNTTGIIHFFLSDICRHSTPDTGISLSVDGADLMQHIKDINYRFIYRNPRFEAFSRYAALVLREVFDMLLSCYTGAPYLAAPDEKATLYPTLVGGFVDFVTPYISQPRQGYDNRKCYGDLTDRTLFTRAVVDYVSGMTDAYLIRAYTELVSF